MSLTATIFHISRGSLNDGHGIRTVVYFKGCNLSCQWCHNPEGIAAGREISFNKTKCIGCGKCVEVCPDCHTSNAFVRTNCTVCGRCVELCTAKALEVVGKKYTVDELFEEVKKDVPFFKRGGGVTLSGGECLLQADFVADFLRRCRENGIHTLVESAFCVSYGSIEKILPYTNKFFVDCKIFDSEKHRLYTGVSNEKIIENIKHFAPKTDVTVRIPLIPNVNDDFENLKKTVAFSKECQVNGVELLRFNPLGASKYESLGRQGVRLGIDSQEKAVVQALVDDLNAFVQEENFVYSIL